VSGTIKRSPKEWDGDGDGNRLLTLKVLWYRNLNRGETLEAEWKTEGEEKRKVETSTDLSEGREMSEPAMGENGRHLRNRQTKTAIRPDRVERGTQA